MQNQSGAGPDRDATAASSPDLREEESKDRISDLPDCILHHILSFLPTREAARTCVLSSSWKTLFHTSPTLNFDDSNVSVFPDDFVTKPYKPSSNSYLHEFITKTVVPPNPYSLNGFSLGWIANRQPSRDQFNSWISAALSRGIQQLHVFSEEVMGTLHALPRDAFLCPTLVVLKLNFVQTKIPANVCLPNLKVLHLGFFDYCASSKRFLSGCLVLEELVIFSYSVPACGNDFSVPTLKTLCIHKVSGESTRGTRCLFHAPCLVRAEIGRMMSWSTSAAPLFKGIRALKVLRLCPNLYGCNFPRLSLPTLPYLTRLVIDGNCQYNGKDRSPLYLDWNVIISILESSIHLQELILLKSSIAVYRENFIPDELPSLVSSHLREIVIKDFGGRKEEITIIKYFLDQARVLNGLTITSTSSMTLEREFFFMNEIMSFCRSSSSCKIKLAHV